jgi:IclR family mhp operon transcriptional activator
VRETTRHQSPLTIDRGTVGLRLPVLLSATGRAHLAFCAEKERQQILENIFSQEETRAGELNATLIYNILAKTRSQGYGYRLGEFMPETGSIAVPIIHGTRVLGCVNITFIATVLSPREAANRYLAPMQKAAQRIEHGFRRCLNG